MFSLRIGSALRLLVSRYLDFLNKPDTSLRWTVRADPEGACLREGCSYSKIRSMEPTLTFFTSVWRLKIVSRCQSSHLSICLLMKLCFCPLRFGCSCWLRSWIGSWHSAGGVRRCSCCCCCC